jgi:hypothetical protein
MKIHTKKIDPYTPVIALTDDAAKISITRYGEIGSPLPYILVSEVIAKLQSESRSDADRFEYLKENELEITHEYNIDGQLDFVSVHNSHGCELVGERHYIKDIREAMDYVMDMDEVQTT